MKDQSGTNQEPIQGNARSKKFIQDSDPSESDLKRAEEKSTEKDRILESMVQSSAVATFVVDAEHRVICWNRACEDLTGMKSDDLLGTRDHWKPFYDSPRPCIADIIIDNSFHEMSSLYNVYARSVLIPEGIRAEGWYPALGGKNRYILFDAAPIRDDRGRMVAAIETLQDITDRKQAEQVIQQEKNLSESIINGLPGIFYLFDAEGKFLRWNRNFEMVSGYSHEEMRERHPSDFFDDQEKERVGQRIRDTFVHGHADVEARFICRNGAGVPYFFTGTRIEINKEPHVMGLGIDISDRKQAEEKLRESEGKYRNILESIEDGYFEVDLAGNLTFFNDSGCRILGNGRAQLMGMNYSQYTDLENQKLVHEAFNEVFRTGEPSTGVEYEIIRKDGTRRYIQSSVSLIRNPSGQPTGFRAIMRNITDRKRMEVEIREMSLRDQLTNLYNRRGFITLAEQQIKLADRAQRPLHLTFIDCDGLKGINDTLGHEEGDRALIATAAVLRRTFRKSDIIARQGGDEFAVLSIDAVEMNSYDFSKRLQENIDAVNATEARSYKLAMSWGMAVYDPQSPLSLDELMSAADKRMYAQKKAKSNRIL